MKLRKIIICMILGGILLFCLAGKSFAFEGETAESQIQIELEEISTTEEPEETEEILDTVLQEESELETTETEVQKETESDEINVTDSYVYDGEIFTETVPAVLGRAKTVTGIIDYSYWSIDGGAGFGNILEDGRYLDHVGCIMLKIGTAWKTAYCIHHNANLQGGHQYADIESYLTNGEKRDLTGCALYYGFKFGSWNPYLGIVPDVSDCGKYTATQVMIWLIEKGWYSYDKTKYSFSLTSKALNVAKTICDKSKQQKAGDSYQYFSKIYEQIQKYGMIPSFAERTQNAAKNYKMGYDVSKNEYSLTLTDSNNILQNCTVSGLPDGATYKIDKNKLHITSQQPINSTIKLSKKVILRQSAVTIWSDQTNTTYQQIGTYAEPRSSAIEAYVKVSTSLKSMNVEKRWDDNNYPERPEQVLFHLYRGFTGTEQDTMIQRIQLDEGNVWKKTIRNLPANDINGNKFIYTFFEEKPDDYDMSVQVTDDTEDSKTFIFTNHLKTGSVALKKVSAENDVTDKNDFYHLENAVYGVYKDENCTLFAGELKTDGDGKSNVLTDLPTGTYYVKEIKAPIGYKLDKELYIIEVKSGETAILQVSDIPYTCSLNILKSDIYKISMEDICFAIYDSDGNKLEEKTTDDSGFLCFGGLPAGEYKIMETGTENGFQLLKDPLKVRLPIVLTEEAFTEWDGDKQDVVYDEESSTYTIYSSTYRIENNRNLNLPMTGGKGIFYMCIECIVGCILAVIGSMMMIDKRKRDAGK